MSIKKIVIIGKDNCSFCTNAQHLSRARQLPYLYLNVPNDLELEDAFKMVGREFSTFPAIFIADENNKMIEYIGGFNEFRSAASKIQL